MICWQTMTGVALGAGAGFALLALAGSGQGNRAASGPILSECSGHVRELVIQYEPAAAGIVATTYRDFLGALDVDIVVHALCPTRAAFEDLISRIGPTRCKVLPIIAGHPITSWARDRWVALGPQAAGRPTTLWSPQGEAGAEAWPARAGDERAGTDIAAALGRATLARRSRLFFDGGDFLADQDNVFVMPRVLIRNIQQTVTNRQEFLSLLAMELKRHIILLNEAPDHHAGMFMASIGNKVMLVADPCLAKKAISTALPKENDSISQVLADLPGGPDFTPQTQLLFDAVADQCAAAGYRVVRIPTIPARDGRTYLTYVNVLMDQPGAHRVVYLPSYRGCGLLNASARMVWESQGYEVRPVDCSDTYRLFGCLHCLVNVLSRSDTPQIARN